LFLKLETSGFKPRLSCARRSVNEMSQTAPTEGSPTAGRRPTVAERAAASRCHVTRRAVARPTISEYGCWPTPEEVTRRTPTPTPMAMTVRVDSLPPAMCSPAEVSTSPKATPRMLLERYRSLAAHKESYRLFLATLSGTLRSWRVMLAGEPASASTKPVGPGRVGHRLFAVVERPPDHYVPTAHPPLGESRAI